MCHVSINAKLLGHKINLVFCVKFHQHKFHDSLTSCKKVSIKIKIIPIIKSGKSTKTENNIKKIGADFGQIMANKIPNQNLSVVCFFFFKKKNSKILA